MLLEETQSLVKLLIKISTILLILTRFLGYIQNLYETNNVFKRIL